MQKLKLVINWLIVLVIVLLPFQTRFIIPNQNWPQIEYLSLSFYFTEILIALVIILSTIRLLLTRKERSKTHRFALLLSCFLAFLLFSNLSLFHTTNYDLYLQKITWLILSTSFCLSILISQIERPRLSFALIMSGVIQSLFAIQQHISQKVFASKWLGMATQTPDIQGVPVIIGESGNRILRVFGSFPHPNILGGFLALTLVISIWYLIKEKHNNCWLCFFIVVQSLGLLFTFSRSAIIAAVAGIITIMIIGLIKKIPRAFTTGLATIILLTILSSYIFQFIHVSISTRFNSINPIQKQSQIERVDQYKESFIIWKNNWLLGVGYGNYIPALIKQFPKHEHWWYQPVHNSLWLMIIEGGIGLTISLITLLYLIFKKIRSENFLFVLPTLIPLFILLLLDHYLYSFYFGIMFTGLIFTFIIKQNQGANHELPS